MTTRIVTWQYYSNQWRKYFPNRRKYNQKKNHVIVSYNNNENSLQDAGISVVIDENNEGWLNLIEDSKTGLGNWKDYFNVIKIDS